MSLSSDVSFLFGGALASPSEELEDYSPLSLSDRAPLLFFPFWDLSSSPPSNFSWICFLEWMVIELRENQYMELRNIPGFQQFLLLDMTENLQLSFLFRQMLHLRILVSKFPIAVRVWTRADFCFLRWRLLLWSFLLGLFSFLRRFITVGT